MKTIQQDLKSSNLSLNEAIDMAQNHPLWRVYVGCYALLVVLARNEEEEKESFVHRIPDTREVSD